ncbi:DUF1593 domain-containing protein [Lachnospiraceae bacterium OttesenSCG-928-D06]|nr:DUF1593 domain-containing protein [Lachnospiraceae bacterium OttesenSCG-928-D06]
MKIIKPKRKRVIVITDISSLQGGFMEPDDTQSLVRFLLYSNEFDVEGLIACAYGDYGIKAEYIEAVVKTYGKVHENLLIHDSSYPSEDYLLSVIKSGSAKVGMEEMGNGKDTEASEWIISVVDKQDERPVWILLWGGALDLAQAVWKVCNTREDTEARQFKDKLRVYSISDQYDNTGLWIKEYNPDIFYITAHKTFRGMYREGKRELVNETWVKEKIHGNHGKLGDSYPMYDGADPWGEVKGIKEGDTPSFLYLIPTGLGNPEEPSYGCWGGRFVGNGRQYRDTADLVEGRESIEATVFRWREAYQADFAARMDWCVKDFEQANHAPVVVVKGETEITIMAGEKLIIDASDSYDPDGDELSFNWEWYREPGSFRGTLQILNHMEREATVMIPNVDRMCTIHVILSVSDKTAYPVTRYQRIIITVLPISNQ